MTIDDRISDFHGQPYFVLGSFGLTEYGDFEQRIEHLIGKHNINLDELKGTRIYKRSKYGFFREVLQYLFTNDIPIFIELTDKRFFLATSLLDNVIVSAPLLVRLTEEMIRYHHAWADYLFHNLSDEAFILFCQAARVPSREAFESLLERLSDEFEDPQDKMSVMLHSLLKDSIEIYREMIEEQNTPRPPHSYFLPPPDLGKGSDIYALLPQTPSFANICARAEAYRDRRGIPRIRFIHDEHSYFDEILEFNLGFLQEFGDTVTLPPSLANRSHFKVTDRSDISFQRSRDSLFIQVADVLAGFVYRSWSEFIETRRLDPAVIGIYRDIIFEFPSRDESAGLNFVVPTDQYAAFRRLLGID